MTLKATSVIDYIVQRLADEGITDCFGVPGDYAFPVCDAVERSPKVRWIGCSNELNASYAADGYARVRGAAMLATTYAVGELSALNGVMGAKAERSLVFHVVGMPSYQNQRLRKTMHHTLGDGAFGNFIDISAQAACCHAVINPDNCMIEMERVIAEARRNNQPAYIVVPSDDALAPVTLTEVRPATLKSNEASVARAVAANDGYLVERALELNPDWSYNDLSKWRYADLPRTLGCADWIAARVETVGELDAAMQAARESTSGAYIEVIGGRMDMPRGLAFAHTRLKELYGDTP